MDKWMDEIGHHVAHVHAYYAERTRLEYEAAYQRSIAREKRHEEELRAWQNKMGVLCEERAKARVQRDFKRADALRAEMRRMGAEPMDYPDGRAGWLRIRR